MNRNKVISSLFLKIMFLICGSLIAGRNATSQVTPEFWPEINGFLKIHKQVRLYFVTAYAEGKESPVRTLDIAGYLDYTLKAFLRPPGEETDWQPTRFLWARFGYDYIFKNTDGERTTPENRGIVSFYGNYIFPFGMLVEARARADLRWIGNEYSTRYRLRLEVNHDFTLFRRTITPYMNAEVFYDTRYWAWSRILVMAGFEYRWFKHFRFEVYLAPQFDYHPERSTLIALGIVAKFYY